MPEAGLPASAVLCNRLQSETGIVAWLWPIAPMTMLPLRLYESDSDGKEKLFN